MKAFLGEFKKFIMRGNVIDIPEQGSATSNYAMAFFQTNVEDCQAYNNCGTYINLFDGSGKGNYLERLTKYDTNNKPAEVDNIIAESGSCLK